MVRRKQQHPRALLGPPEARNADRIDVTRPLAPVPASADSASAVHRSQTSCDKASVITSIFNDHADVVLLRHLAIHCKELSSITGARAGSQLSLSLTYEAPVIILWELHGRVPDSFPSCSGKFLANSSAAAQGLILLLQQSKVAMQLVAASDHRLECGIYFCLHRACLESDHASDAEDQTQRLWHKHLQAVFAWLLPEFSTESQVDLSHGNAPVQLHMTQALLQRQASCTDSAAINSTSPPSASMSVAADDLLEGEGFDAAELYAAVKPSGNEPQLPQDNPKLRPTLRPYQRRAAAWMVGRETGAVGKATSTLHPLWRKITALDSSVFYYNPFTGRVSKEGFPPTPPVLGGILSDEMGLGKTVELLACMLAHPFSPSTHAPPQKPKSDSNQRQKVGGKREREERINCVCGVTAETPAAEQYPGLWLQCDECLSWLHGACVGYPKRAPKGDFVCGRCTRARASQQVVADCGATLIVCPASILHQWQSEIAKHTQPGALRVITYLGQSKTSLNSLTASAHAGDARPSDDSQKAGAEPVRKGRKGKHSGQDVVSAQDLASADVVLTTYDVLKRDVHHQADPGQQGKTFRTRKRYEVIPTPLTRLCWWRVCLDEAQMVETSTAKAAEMAGKLAARHRWCITGTPLSRGLEDLFGLLYFLRAAPLHNKFWWARVCQRPYEAGSQAGRARLLSILKPSEGGLLWRTAKADVADELGLPPQHQQTSSLQFSAIERHFYSRQHADCTSRASSTIPPQLLSQAAQGGPGGVVGHRRLTAAEEKKLLFPLLRLRQACCHPQVGAGGIKSLGAARAPMSMAEILDVLVSKAKLEAEDAQRVLLGALNGLAALMLLETGPTQAALAIKTYREALALSEQNKEMIRADKLQKLHTLHNLAQLLKEGDLEGLPGVPHTLRDSTLQAEAQSLRDGYLAESIAKLAVADKEYQDALHAMNTAADFPDDSGADEADTGHAEAGSAAATGTAVGSKGCADWWLGAIDLLVRSSPSQGDNIADLIKEQLMERDRYNRLVGQNATSLSRRFTRLYGLQPLLLTELSAMDTARTASLATLNTLAKRCGHVTQSFVDQAGQCGRCRGELGVAGQVCQHCRLDEQFVGWEVRIYSLQTHAMAAGQAVTAEEAIIRAQAAALRQVGRGGLNEQAGSSNQDAAEEGASGGQRRGDTTAVSTAEIVRHPSETEQVLRILATQLRSLKHLSPHTGAARDALVAQSKAHLEVLEMQRKLYLRSRSLSLAQRAFLYAHDELDMSMMRMQLRAPGQAVKPHEQHFRLQPFEVPLKNRELTNDRLGSEADLTRLLGTLRYLHGLKAARQHVEFAATSSQNNLEQHEAFASTTPGVGCCPVCHDVLGSELVMLPCGHQLCCKCSMTIIDRAPQSASPQGKKISCPTCRARTKVTDVAYVDNGRGVASQEGEGGEPSCSSAAQEAAIQVEGSYGTKLEAVVRRIKHLLQQDAAAKVLVFSSWQDVLELVSHALHTNKLPYAYARGRKAFDDAVADFKQHRSVESGRSDGIQILLLLVKQGANGLNLTEAQHVVLTEPLLDPAVEAQAVGRVHRIGQTQPTFVHRFVIEATVEENVQRLSSQRAAAMDLSAAAGVTRGKQVGQQEPLTVRDVALLLQQNWTAETAPGQF